MIGIGENGCEGYINIYHKKMNRYQKCKEAALDAGETVQNLDFVETLSFLIEFTEKISGGRAAEMMETVTHLLRCRKVCFDNKLMRKVELEHNH